MAAFSCFTVPSLRVLRGSLFIATLLGSPACSDEVLRLGAAAETVGSVDGLLLRDAATGALNADLIEGSSLRISALPSTDVSFEALVSGNVASVEFEVDGASTVEIEAPFTYPGDTAGVLKSFRAIVGEHMVRVTPYSAAAAKGQQGATLQRRFTFVD